MLGAITLGAGTVATAAGPHAGGEGTGDVVPRLDWRGADTLDWAIHQHGILATLLGLAAVGTWFLLRARKANDTAQNAMTAICVLLACQGFVGTAQYAMELPPGMVWIHVVWPRPAGWRSCGRRSRWVARRRRPGRPRPGGTGRATPTRRSCARSTATAGVARARRARYPRRLDAASGRLSALGRDLLVGIAMRAWAWIAFSPAIMNSAHADTYIAYAHTSVMADVVHPAGYALFLKDVGWFSGSWPELTILIQNVMGIATALIGFALVRRLGGPRWAGSARSGGAPVGRSDRAGVPVHARGTVHPAHCRRGVLCSAGAQRRTRRRHRQGRNCLAGGFRRAAGLAMYVRTVALVLVPFLVLWSLFVLPRPSLRRRIVPGLATASSAVIVLLLYAGVNELKSGYFGLTRYSDWAVYIRTAQFADCSKFTPPDGTSGLCERVPSDERNGGDFYAWEPGSPARRLFGGPPAGETTGAFGRAAVLNQPLAYAETVVNDALRFYAHV